MTTTWLGRTMYSLDTESTSLNTESARVVTLTLGRSTSPGHWSPKSYLLDPGVEIPAEATAVHGITTEHAQKEGMQPGHALHEVWLWLTQIATGRTPLVIFNAPYDLTLLDREFRRHLGEPLPTGLIVLDTLVLFRRFDWTTGGRSLGKLAARYGITFPAHDAEADALASLRLLHILAALNDLLPLVEPAALHEAQKTWWVLQQDAAESRALGSGTAFERQDCWPLIPFTDGAES